MAGPGHRTLSQNKNAITTKPLSNTPPERYLADGGTIEKRRAAVSRDGAYTRKRKNGRYTPSVSDTSEAVPAGKHLDHRDDLPPPMLLKVCSCLGGLEGAMLALERFNVYFAHPNSSDSKRA